MKTLTLTRAAVAGGLTALMLGAAALPAFAQTWTNNPDGQKAYVCKYVGKPGEAMTLKEGANPIVVDRGEEMAIGSQFADAQGASLVIGFGDVSDEVKPVTSDCPATLPVTPTPTPVVTPAPTTTPVVTPAATTEVVITTTPTTPPRGVLATTGVEDEIPVAPFAALALVTAAGGAVALKRRH